MRIVLINHSDTKGGASVVTLRLLEALRRKGHDATLLVLDKSTGSEGVCVGAGSLRKKASFIAEHLRIFAANGFDRTQLFKVSLATDGTGLDRHPLVRQADAVLVNWVNQGMMSLDEVGRIAAEKPVIWTMHDMWNATGICHHAGDCRRYMGECGYCPLLGRKAAANDLSHTTWHRKKQLYDNADITFVAVSTWLADICRRSSLLHDKDLVIIPNAFPVDEFYLTPRKKREDIGLPGGKKIIVMGAARLDDPIKGLPLAVEALNKLERDDAVAVFFGGLRDPRALDGLRFPHVYLGTIHDRSTISELYAQADVLISSSLYETLPGTLIEAQAAGCTPVAFNSGGQRDIISSPELGHLVKPYDTDEFARALDSALTNPASPEALRRSVVEKYAADMVAEQYLSLIRSKL